MLEGPIHLKKKIVHEDMLPGRNDSCREPMAKSDARKHG
jgi:hypothetical protein